MTASRSHAERVVLAAPIAASTAAISDVLKRVETIPGRSRFDAEDVTDSGFMITFLEIIGACGRRRYTPRRWDYSCYCLVCRSRDGEACPPGLPRLTRPIGHGVYSGVVT